MGGNVVGCLSVRYSLKPNCGLTCKARSLLKVSMKTVNHQLNVLRAFPIWLQNTRFSLFLGVLSSQSKNHAFLDKCRVCFLTISSRIVAQGNNIKSTYIMILQIMEWVALGTIFFDLGLFCCAGFGKYLPSQLRCLGKAKQLQVH